MLGTRANANVVKSKIDLPRHPLLSPTNPQLLCCLPAEAQCCRIRLFTDVGLMRGSVDRQYSRWKCSQITQHFIFSLWQFKLNCGRHIDLHVGITVATPPRFVANRSACNPWSSCQPIVVVDDLRKVKGAPGTR